MITRILRNRDIKKFFVCEKETPITDRLIRGGYIQSASKDSYRGTARKMGVSDPPTQYWHLIHCWSAQSPDDAPFTRSIQSGELLFFMAEYAGAVSTERLNALCDRVLGDVKNRKYMNRVIQKEVFDAIVNTVTEAVA